MFFKVTSLKMLKFKNVVVGISGGVDSAVTALLLKNKGYIVNGVFLQNWDIADEQGHCSADEDYKDAQLVCDKLKIPLLHVNFVKHYWNEVFCNLIKEYENGSTPNPDVLCNRYIKFNHFYKYAVNNLGADAIATGHYAKTNFGPYLENYQPNEKARLWRAKDKVKDQTFFLCQIEQEALQKTMFPLGELSKLEVKQLAAENGLKKMAAKKESMGICFIGLRNFQEFISEYVENKPGNFVDIDSGKVVGNHNGFHHWTLGQRSRIPAVPKSYYIAKKDISTNIIYVAMGTKHPALFTTLLFTSKPHWIHSRPPDFMKHRVFDCQFQFQHVQKLVNCQLCETDKGLIVRLFKGMRAITEGQYAVFYKDNECLGSAKITSPGPSHFTVYWLKNHGICKESIILDKHKSIGANDNSSQKVMEDTHNTVFAEEICNKDFDSFKEKISN